MLDCPSCKAMAFDRTALVCTACGWKPPERRPQKSTAPARVVTGTPAAPAPLPLDALTEVAPEPLPMDALEPVAPAPLPMDALQPAEPEFEMMPGFESTMLVEEPFVPPEPTPPPTLEELGFQYDACPSCKAPQPKPNPVLCDGCGMRLKRKRKKDAEDAPAKRCMDCGTHNGADRSACLNCGARLPDPE